MNQNYERKQEYCDDVYKLLNKDDVFLNKLSSNLSFKQKQLLSKYTIQTVMEVLFEDLGDLIKKTHYNLEQHKSLRNILSNDRRFQIIHSELRGKNIVKLSSRIVTVETNTNIINYCNQVVNLLSIDSLILNKSERSYISLVFLGSRIRKESFGLKNMSFTKILQNDQRLELFQIHGHQVVKLSNIYQPVPTSVLNENNNNTNYNSSNRSSSSSRSSSNYIADISQNNRNTVFAMPSQEDLEKDKAGLTIERNINLSCEPRYETSKVIKVIDSNPGRKKSLILKDVNFLTTAGFQNIVGNFSISRLSGSSSNVSINYNPYEIGIHKCVVVFHFGHYNGHSNIQIARFIKGTCYSNKNMFDTLNAGTPYKRKQRVSNYARISQAAVITRDWDIPKQKVEFLVKLARYEIPDEMRSLTFQSVEFEREIIEMKNSEEVNMYSDYFRRLLFIEEIQWEHDIRSHDLKDAIVSHEGPYLKLPVPGLQEKRPSVIRGDTLLFIYEGKQYRGDVMRVELSHVLVSFHSSLHRRILNSSRVDVVFEFKRTSLRLLHQGLEKLENLSIAKQIIHPHPSNNSPRVTPIRSFFNRNLNDQQKNAVSTACSGSYIPCPFIIFGPPGTGKTETMVEAIKQMHKMSTNKILVLAPSNDAADNLLRRLDSIPRSEMFRLTSYSRDKGSVDEKTMRYSHYESDGFQVPDNITEYRVIVSTIMMAAKLYNMGFGDDHFNSFFIDEAGYCWEPEIISILGTLYYRGADVNKMQRCVLAGDPHQLGPIIRSQLTLRLGLDKSMIERLTSNESYVYSKNVDLYPDTSGYNPNYIVKLLNCYRCHPDILKIPNELFYDCELQSAADPVKTNSMLRWDGLLNSNFPLIFHGVEGENRREGNSPSWFNVQEIETCINYVKQLKDSKGSLGLTLKDVCIITPYNQQVTKLRKALMMIGCSDVDCGSVERFQGQERKVVILSTVRSDPKYIEIDIEHNLGFIKSPKRFNVSCTRAISLLIIIGSPKTLNTDGNWSKLLWYCVDNNAYKGVLPLPKRPDDINPVLEFDDLKEALQGFNNDIDINDENENENMNIIHTPSNTFNNSVPWILTDVEENDVRKSTTLCLGEKLAVADDNNYYNSDDDDDDSDWEKISRFAGPLQFWHGPSE